GGLSTPAQAGQVQAFAQPPQSSAYYRNCDAARSAGAAPLYRGDPGYRSPLDRDGDGIACEPYRGR
ncbi:excalibur calcium-binding domain-containing protein, partial [Parasphingorhabdus sp.]|uniref:excalibur calcium-binding domain-containing protein n=1 Tax=Parasphingorhabdus sp. TaxID=2709688 RepID=UPI0030034526